jgi:hypothetical protein
MRTALLAAAALLNLVISAPAYSQQTPVQQRNNDASVDGAVRSQGTPGRTLENRTPEGDPRGSAASESGPADRTTTGSPPSAVGNSIETETGLGTIMDSDESEASRNRAPGGERR